MIKGIGTDLLSVKRISKVINRHGDRFAQKILGPVEMTDYAAATNQINFVAKRFASKEAVSKALGCGMSMGVRWQDIQLLHHESGQPRIQLSGQALAHFNTLQASAVHITLTDEQQMILAFAVIE